MIRILDGLKIIEKFNLKTKKREKRKITDLVQINHIFDPEAQVDDKGGVKNEMTFFIWKDKEKWEMKMKKGFGEKCFFFDCFNVFMYNWNKFF